MSRLIDAIEHEGWRVWALGLPTVRHPEPNAVQTYLLSLQEKLENRPDVLDPLSREARRALIEVLSLHYDIIAYEVDRAGRAAEAQVWLRAGADAAGLLGSAEVKAAAGGLKALAGGSQRERDKRQALLEKQADAVRKLLLLMRAALIGQP